MIINASILSRDIKIQRTRQIPRGLDGIFFPDKFLIKYKPQENKQHELSVLMHEYCHAALYELLTDHTFNDAQIEFMCDAFGKIVIDLVRNNADIVGMIAE